MEYLNFPILALAAALVCLIGVSIYAIMQRGALRNRDEQLVVARAQAYAMLELSQAGVLFLDREHKLLSRDIAAVDLRIAGRLVVKLTPEAALRREAALAALKKAAGRKPGKSI